MERNAGLATFPTGPASPGHGVNGNVLAPCIPVPGSGSAFATYRDNARDTGRVDDRARERTGATGRLRAALPTIGEGARVGRGLLSRSGTSKRTVVRDESAADSARGRPGPLFVLASSEIFSEEPLVLPAGDVARVVGEGASCATPSLVLGWPNGDVGIVPIEEYVGGEMSRT